MALKDIPDSWLFKALRWLPKFILLIAAFLLIGMYMRIWLLELVVSLLPQAMIVISGIYLVLFTLYARFIIRDGWHQCKQIVGGGDLFLLSASVVAVLTVLYQSLSIVQPLELSSGGSPPFTVATYNNFKDNPSIDDAADFFVRHAVDVLVMQETGQQKASEMSAKLGLTYTSQTDCNCSADESEIFILSRYELGAAESVFEYSTGAIHRVEVNHPQIGLIAVYGVHLPTPYTPNGYKQRSIGYDRLSERLRLETERVIVAGDFNTTVFSPDYQRFASAMDDQLQPLFLREWPRCSWHGFGDITCLRIDHLFVSLGANLKSLNIGKYTGSDHRPITATIQFN